MVEVGGEGSVSVNFTVQASASPLKFILYSIRQIVFPYPILLWLLAVSVILMWICDG